jgi:hypothetical protein
MGFGLGNIFRDVIDDFGFFERLIGEGPAFFVNDSNFDLFQDIGIRLGFDLGIYASPYSQEERDNALPPVIPGQPLDTFEGIILDLPPERVTEFMQDMFEFFAGVDPAYGGGQFQNFDSYTFLV